MTIETMVDLERACKERDVEIVEEPVMIERMQGIFWACMSSAVVFILTVGFSLKVIAGPPSGYVEIKIEKNTEYQRTKRNLDSMFYSLLYGIPGIRDVFLSGGYDGPRTLKYEIMYGANQDFVINRVKDIADVCNKSEYVITYKVETLDIKNKRMKDKENDLFLEIESLKLKLKKLQKQLSNSQE